jgi:hypothetical protein
MFKNRFENCKSLEDLRNVIVNGKFTFRGLSKEEIDSINSLLSNKIKINNDSDFNKLEKAFKTKTDDKQGDDIMSEIKVTTVTEENIKNPDGTLNENGIKITIDAIAKDLCESADGNAETEQIKAKLVSISKLLEVLGLKKLKLDFDAVICAGCNANGNVTQINNMMEEVTRLFKEEIKRLDFWATDKTLKQSFALKALVGEEGYGNKNVFEAIASGILNIIKRVAGFIKDKYSLAEEKAKSLVIKAILKGIRELFGALIQGVKAIVKIAGGIVSFTLCGISIIGYWVFNTIKKLLEKLSERANNNNNTVEVSEDDFLQTEDSSESVII